MRCMLQWVGNKTIFDMQEAENVSYDIYELAIMKDFKMTDFHENNRYLSEIRYESEITSFPIEGLLSAYAKSVGTFGNLAGYESQSMIWKCF